MTQSVLMVFAKAPVPGKVKTRLIPALGAEGACDLYRTLLSNTLAKLEGFDGEKQLWVTEPEAQAWQTVPAGWSLHEQQGADLGARMAAAFEWNFNRAKARVLVVGTDCPDLTLSYCDSACAGLDQFDAVLGPANDGGYVLLALARYEGQVFEAIDWGTEQVLAQTLAQLKTLGMSVQYLQALADIDNPEDLPGLE